MTIYEFELKAVNLNRLPSAHFVLGLCSHICEHILDHFHDNLLKAKPYAQSEVSELTEDLFCRINTFSRHLQKLVTKGTLEVHYIKIAKAFHNVVPPFRQEFDAVTLTRVPPKILLEFMSKLLNESLLSLKTSVLWLPCVELDTCTSALRAIPDSLSGILNVECSSRPNLLHVEMRVKSCDKNHKIVRY